MARTLHPLRRGTLCVLAASVALAGTPPVWAQALRGNPQDALPPQPAAPASEVRVETTPPPRPAQPGRAVTPQRFTIEGVRSLPFEQVARLFQPLVGQATTVAAIVERAQQATQLYEKAGYALSFVFVPEQDLAQGIVRVVAVEGHVAEVRVEGDSGRSQERIAAIAEAVRREKPLTLATFQRMTGLLAQLPGFTIVARIPSPTTTGGGTALTLAVQRKAVNVTLGGEIAQPQPRVVLTGELNDTLLPGGQVSVSTLVHPLGKEHYYAVGAVQPVGSDGLVLRASASLYEAAPSQASVNGAVLAHESRNHRVELSASQPLLLTATRSLVASGGFYGTGNDDAFHNTGTGAWVADESRVRAVYAQLAYNEIGADRSRSASLLVARGIDALGARAELVSNLAGAGGPSPVKLDFTRVQLQAAQTQRWRGGFGTALSLLAQVADGPLPASERIGFGGSRFARGYAPGETAGDAGWGLGLEVNRAFAPREASSFRLEPYLLAEAARVYARSAPPVPAHLLSLSLGLRVSDQKHYTLDFALSRPLGERPLENPERHARGGLLVTYRLD